MREGACLNQHHHFRRGTISHYSTLPFAARWSQIVLVVLLPRGASSYLRRRLDLLALHQIMSRYALPQGMQTTPNPRS